MPAKAAVSLGDMRQNVEPITETSQPAAWLDAACESVAAMSPAENVALTSTIPMQPSAAAFFMPPVYSNPYHGGTRPCPHPVPVSTPVLQILMIGAQL